MELEHGIQGSKLLVARGGVRIGIVPPLELVTCSHVFSPQLPLNQTCKLSSPNTSSFSISRTSTVVDPSLWAVAVLVVISMSTEWHCGMNLFRSKYDGCPGSSMSSAPSNTNINFSDRWTNQCRTAKIKSSIIGIF